MKGSVRTGCSAYNCPQLHIARAPSIGSQEMASLYEQIHSLRGHSIEHLFNITTSLNSAGFDLRSKREGWVLRHINIDSLPFLDASERATLRYLATGEPWRGEMGPGRHQGSWTGFNLANEAQKRRQDRAEWWRSWLSIIPCWTLSGDEPGAGQHVQGPTAATATGDQACGSSAVLAVPSQQQPLCRRRAHQEGTQEVPTGVPEGAE